MDFDKVIYAHSQWKSHLRRALQGQEQIDPVAAAKDDQCELGKWLQTEGLKCNKYPEFGELKMRHTEFHAIVGSVLRQAKGLSAEQALQLVVPSNSQFAHASNACINAIANLRKAVEGK